MIAASGQGARVSSVALSCLILASFDGWASGPPAIMDGSLDGAWGTGGRMLVADDPDFGLRISRAVGFHVVPGHKLLLAGGCQAEGISTFCAAQVLADGTPDTGFGPGGNGQVRMDGMPQGAVMFASARAADGSILLAGRLPAGADPAARIARLTPLGVPDPATGGGSGYVDFHFSRADGTLADISTIIAMTTLPDGKVLVAGIADSASNNIDFAIARLYADLSVDPAFGTGGTTLVGFDLANGNFEAVRAMAVQRDGKIVLAGHTGDTSASTHIALATRLEADGALDVGFGNGGRLHFTNGGSDLYFTAVALDRQSRILLAGSIVGMQGHEMFVTRVGAGGAHDLGFGVAGNRIVPVSTSGDFDDAANALEVQSDGRILLAGWARRDAGASTWAAARVLPSGHLDGSFGTDGIMQGTFVPAPSPGLDDSATAIAVANGGVMVAGFAADPVAPANTSRFGLARLALDLVFTDGHESDDPAIVEVEGIDLVLNPSPVGTSIQWHTGSTCGYCDAPPFDFTAWGTNLRMFWPFVSVGAHRGGVAEGDVYSVLASGTTVGPASQFSLAESDAATAQWRQLPGVDGYLGFRFQNPVTGLVNYGYAHLTTSGGSGYPAILHGYAYNRVGGSIRIP